MNFAFRRADRFAGAALAILVQALLIALLIASRPLLAPPEKLAHELTLILPRLRETPPPAPLVPLRESARPLQAPLPQVALPPNPDAPAAVPPDFSKLGQSIFGCAPENYSSLTPEQRALCPRPGEGVTVRQAPGSTEPPSQAKDEKHWAEELAKRNAPLTDTCLTFKRHAIGTVMEDYTLMVDPACAVEKLQKTFDK